MNLKKKILAAVAAVTIGWSVVAHADPNVPEAMNNYFVVLDEIHNHCVLMWTYDPAPNSDYTNCIGQQKYYWANIMLLASSIYANDYYPDQTNVGQTYYLVYEWLWYWPP